MENETNVTTTHMERGTTRESLAVFGTQTIASSYFNEALLVYKQWKAHRKVDHLQAEVKSMFGT